MWQTSHGDRVLQGAEANAFLEAVGYLRDMVVSAIDTEDSYQTGVRLFDALQPTQQLVALHRVATALMKPEVEAPELSATLEATVYAIYHELYCLVEIEIDCCRLDNEFEMEIRQRVLDACCWPIESEGDWEPFELDEQDLPSVECDDFDTWRMVIEQLADRVLWDRDFELEEILADKDPQETEVIKEYLGIRRDYFVDAAPDAVTAEFRQLDKELVNLRNRQGAPTRREELEPPF